MSAAQGVPEHVRFYRDFSAADFTFCTIFTAIATYASFSYHSLRSNICEELSRHGDLMRDLAEIGLSPENCEPWLERAVMVFVGVMFAVIVMRVSRMEDLNILTSDDKSLQLHVLIVVSNYYLHISRFSKDLPSRQSKDGAFRRIYLLPNHTSHSPSADSHVESTALVYAPVALDSLSERDVQGLNAREAWIHTNASHPTRQHRRSHSRGHRHSNGRIVLPTEPDEGLLRVHEKYKD